MLLVVEPDADLISPPSSSSVVVSSDLSWRVAPGTFVRQLNDNAASAWYGAVWGTGINGIKNPDGNPGERIRMYHPRLGRWIVQQIVFVGLCCFCFKKNNIQLFRTCVLYKDGCKMAYLQQGFQWSHRLQGTFPFKRKVKKIKISALLYHSFPNVNRVSSKIIIKKEIYLVPNNVLRTFFKDVYSHILKYIRAFFFV